MHVHPAHKLLYLSPSPKPCLGCCEAGFPGQPNRTARALQACSCRKVLALVPLQKQGLLQPGTAGLFHHALAGGVLGTRAPSPESTQALPPYAVPPWGLQAGGSGSNPADTARLLSLHWALALPPPGGQGPGFSAQHHLLPGTRCPVWSPSPSSSAPTKVIGPANHPAPRWDLPWLSAPQHIGAGKAALWGLGFWEIHRQTCVEEYSPGLGFRPSSVSSQIQAFLLQFYFF